MVSDYVPAVALLLASLCISAYAAAHVRADDKKIAVLFPLSNSYEQNIALATSSGAHIVRMGASDNILIVESLSDDTPRQLYDMGAIAIFNPQVAGECITGQPNPSSGAL